MPYGAPFELPSVKTKGAIGSFYERLAYGAERRVWPKYCVTVQSDTKTENHAFAGAVPKPQVLEGDRRFQSMIDFTYSKSDERYELSFVIDRDTIDDDQTGTVARRINEVADACNAFEDATFATLISNGDVSGNTAYDGVVFFGDTRVIGLSANIDNNLTTAAASGTVPNASEFLDAVGTAKATMWNFQDDQGRAGMIQQALTQLRTLIPATYERAAMEAGNSTLMPQATTLTNSSIDNVFGRGLTDFDVLPFLVEADEMIICAVGGETKPFLMQERMSTWEIVLFDDEKSVADNHGLKVLCYKRFAFGYGEPRMAILHTFS